MPNKVIEASGLFNDADKLKYRMMRENPSNFQDKLKDLRELDEKLGKLFSRTSKIENLLDSLEKEKNDA